MEKNLAKGKFLRGDKKEKSVVKAEQSFQMRRLLSEALGAIVDLQKLPLFFTMLGNC